MVRNLLIIGVGLLCTACMPAERSSTNSADLPNSNTSAAIDVPTSPAPEPANMQGMLDTHNAVRAVVGVPPLTWSGRMSDYAQEWATHLANNHHCQMQHRTAAGIAPLKVGEHIFWASPLRWSDGRVEIQHVTPTQVAEDWASEKADYDYASNSCASGKECGHYTQLVWNNSLEVGCGMALCPDKSQIWVCNYNPPGNWVGERPY